MDDYDFTPGSVNMAPFEALFHEETPGAPHRQWAIVWSKTGVVQVCQSEQQARVAAATLKDVVVQYRYITAWVQEGQQDAA